MAWLNENKDWVPKKNKKPTSRTKLEKVYSISEVAEILSVHRQTIMKWLSFDSPEDAIIPPKKWFKLPNGHIRIRESIIIELLKAE